MPISIRIPVQLRTLTNGQEVITGTGRSVLEIIEDIDRQYPGLKDRICEPGGKVRRFVNIFVNEEDIRFLENVQTSITENDEISIIPAIAGGKQRGSGKTETGMDRIYGIKKTGTRMNGMDRMKKKE